MKQAQPSTTEPEAALRPVSGQKTATGVFDTWSGSNLWERHTFTTELRWGVRYSQSDPLDNRFAIKDGLFPYAAGNPLRFQDSLGLECGPCCDTPAAIEEDMADILASVNRQLFLYHSTHLHVPQTKCGTYAAIVEKGIKLTAPKCHDWADVSSKSRAWLDRELPAHIAMIVKPCGTDNWEDGTILDPWPSGILGQYPWDNWRPRVFRMEPLVEYGVSGTGMCPEQ